MRQTAAALRKELLETISFSAEVISELRLLRDALNDILSTSQTFDDDSVLLKGWILLRKPKKTFKRRFAVLHRDGCHLFEQPFGNELKFVESSDIQDVSWIDDTTKKSFHLQCADATYEVSATDESVTTWFAKLNASKPVGFSLASESAMVVKEGFLNKAKEKGQVFRGKKKRYCVMDDYTLKYFEKKDGKFLGQMELIGMKLAPVLDRHQKTVGIRLKCADGSGYLFTQAPPEGDSMDSWLGAFRSATLKLKPQMEDSIRASSLGEGSDLSRSSSFSSSDNPEQFASSVKPAPVPAPRSLATPASRMSSGPLPQSIVAQKTEDVASEKPLPALPSTSLGKSSGATAALKLDRKSSGAKPGVMAQSSSSAVDASQSAVVSPKGPPPGSMGGFLLPGMTNSPVTLRKVVKQSSSTDLPPPPSADMLPPPPLAADLPPPNLNRPLPPLDRQSGHKALPKLPKE